LKNFLNLSRTPPPAIPLIGDIDKYDDVELLEIRRSVKKLEREWSRYRARTDLWYLLTEVLGCSWMREHINSEWIHARCIEVQAEPDGVLDLWARDHLKSSIITFGMTIQDILCSHGEGAFTKRECVVGIFSHTRPIAKGFLRQIKREFEENAKLLELFPDIFYENPFKDSPKWSEDDGLIVKRKSNPKESTIEAWGLIDSQPISKHFSLKVYDDVVTKDSVATSEMIEKTKSRFELSDNLGVSDGTGKNRYIGTRYHFNDLYGTLIDNGIKVRFYPCTDDGTMDGNPVLITKEEMIRKRAIQGIHTFNCQMLLNPIADKLEGFERDWLQYYDTRVFTGMNIYLLCDPANSKKKYSDYTVFTVIGLGSDNNYYLIDMIRDRLNLTERCKKLFELHRKYDIIGVGYEKYSMQADIEYIKSEQNRTNYRFQIVELGGNISKKERIKRLIPLFEQGRFYIPEKLVRKDYEGTPTDLIASFIDEYSSFPVAKHDDIMDCIARIIDEDMHAIPPKYEAPVIIGLGSHKGSWMAV